MKFIALLCLGFSWLLNAGAAEPKPIDVRAGQEFKITLQSNPTTGYLWRFAKPPDEKFLKLVSTKYQAPESKLVGAGGSEVWTFKALAEGKTTLELNYQRPWEKSIPPAQSTNFVVVITGSKAKVEAPAASGH
jgi:inhibitor of cysteine peptidase